MAIYWITGVIVILSLMQTSREDKKACYVFWVPLVALCLIESFIPAPEIYFVCSAVAVISAVFLLKLKSKLATALSSALFISMGINLVGVGLWYYELNQNSYYISFIIFYLWVVVMILQKGKINWLKRYGAYRRRLGLLRLHIISLRG